MRWLLMLLVIAARVCSVRPRLIGRARFTTQANPSGQQQSRRFAGEQVAARRSLCTTRLSSEHARVSGNLDLPRTVLCRSEDEILKLGARLSEVTDIGDVLLLRGDLGAGKTTLARGLIRHKFSDESMRVTSPSYLLDNSYEFDENRTIHHMDLYRLPTGCDLGMLGIPGIFSTCLCIIEWPQRMGDKMPAEYLEIEMTIGKNEERMVKLIPSSKRWESIIINMVLW